VKGRHLRRGLTLLYRRLDEWVKEELHAPTGQKGGLICQLLLPQNQARFATIIVDTARHTLGASNRSSRTTLDS
jgi:hypothetical protein